MRQILHINNDWEFTPAFDIAFLRGEGKAEAVRLPHTCKVTPYNYFDESIYQMVCGYRKRLDLSARGDRRAFICFGAAAHYARVYLDGELIGEHKSGYTSFEFELVTDNLSPLLVVELDTRENLNFPPFGKVIDYLTYGGLYREVRLEYREQSYIDDVFAKPSIPDTIRVTPRMNPKLVAGLTFEGTVDCEIDLVGEADEIRLSLTEKGGKTALAEATFAVGSDYTLKVPRVHLWDPLSPALYELKAELIRDGVVIDTLTRRVGFRRAEFRKDGFFLNGRRFKLRGLNRHQSYPYVGYAMPRSMQRMDADLLKGELGCNAVRTSHYPQSHHFIGRCDELGMPVFTEAPGWQNLGDDEWKDVGVEAVREMVREYRNHPSIILWGVRINESQDDHDFYVRTNEAARSLDPTRATGGVRCHKNSELLEDVYTYNDFVHDGVQPGCEPKRAVTSDVEKAYLVSEYGGHMYSTKAYDDEEHRLEHMLRHARTLDAVASYDDIAGSFAWCMFDYNTHKEFGSGDRICYHGVCDMFRNKKLAAELYAIQDSDQPILQLSSSMDIGDHPATNRGRVYILTNADSVRFYKNDSFIHEYTHEGTDFPHLKFPPIEITDYIGDRIAENEDFTPKQAEYVKDILNESSRFGMNNLSVDAKGKAAYLMMRYGMDHDAAYRLYGKYIGNWGDKSTVFRLEAYKDGKLVKELRVSPFEKRVLTAQVDHTELVEAQTYDVAAVRIRMTDQNGNDMPYFFGAVNAQVSGDIELIGESPVILRAGMGGVYVRTVGTAGEGTLTLSAEGCDSVTVRFCIEVKA
ncbi:glycoside hydrolase family 2 TIM barrel-domain containing protein [uncultured Ruminococcus sp.]|uniref:glycoside hydrolase family 2 protein n=1 Tax=uncultured Ruminococcus sp. TaxID=165186 RepID=UPI00292DE863|nr:glycoside hydrolase family 2 TIM barrel-domain containing protein [uncultured Ruminococcus sp.]